MWVRHRFHKGMNLGDYHSKHEVYSKWEKMNKAVMLSNDLYNNIKRQWKSGECDDVISQKAPKVYQKENKNVFKFHDVWNLVKDSKKWKASKTSEEHIDNGSKPSRTSQFNHTTSNTHVGFNLNDDNTFMCHHLPNQWEGTKQMAKAKVKCQIQMS